MVLFASSDQLSNGLFNVTYTFDCKWDIENLLFEYLAIFDMIDVLHPSQGLVGMGNWI